MRKPPFLSSARTILPLSSPSGSGRCLGCSKHFSNRCCARGFAFEYQKSGGMAKKLLTGKSAKIVFGKSLAAYPLHQPPAWRDERREQAWREHLDFVLAGPEAACCLNDRHFPCRVMGCLRRRYPPRLQEAL